MSCVIGAKVGIDKKQAFEKLARDRGLTVSSLLACLIEQCINTNTNNNINSVNREVNHEVNQLNLVGNRSNEITKEGVRALLEDEEDSQPIVNRGELSFWGALSFTALIVAGALLFRRPRFE